MKKVLLPALESCNDQTVTDEEQSIEAILLTLMEDEQEANAIADEIEKKYDNIKEIEASVERLESLRDVIDKYGISRPMMEAADPYGELSAVGICCSYEELAEVAIKDDRAQFVVTELNRMIDVSNASIEGLHNAIFDKMKTWFRNIKDLFAKQAKTLGEAHALLNGLSVNEEEFLSRKLSLINKKDILRIDKSTKHFSQYIDSNKIKSLVDLTIKLLNNRKVSEEELTDYANKVGDYYNHLRKLDGETCDVIGIKALGGNSERDVPYASARSSIKYRDTTIRDHGFVYSDVEKIYNISGSIYNQSKHLSDSGLYYIVKLDDDLFHLKKETDDEKRFHTLFVTAYNFLRVIYFMANDVWEICQELASMYIRLANAALKSKQ